MPDVPFQQLVGAEPWFRQPRPGSWEAVEEFAGVALPEDFKEFVGMYGDGLIHRHLYIPHPNGATPMIEFMQAAREKLDQVLPQYVRDYSSLSFDPQDLVPLGHSNWDGDDCFLVPREEGEWDIFVIFRQMASVHVQPGGFRKFVTGVLTEEVMPPDWPVFEPRWAPVEGSPLI